MKLPKTCIATHTNHVLTNNALFRRLTMITFIIVNIYGQITSCFILFLSECVIMRCVLECM